MTHTPESRARRAAAVAASWTPERRAAASKVTTAQHAAKPSAARSEAATAKNRATWTPERRAAFSAHMREAHAAALRAALDMTAMNNEARGIVETFLAAAQIAPSAASRRRFRVAARARGVGQPVYNEASELAFAKATIELHAAE